MHCDIVKDLIPLYIDGCCSEESHKAVEAHMEHCAACKQLWEDMNQPAQMPAVAEPPKVIGQLNNWKASLLQSVLLFVSFLLMAIGVALEARTPSGISNGFWAINLVVPATGFMLSLANWYFVRLYKSRRQFSVCSLLTTLCITVALALWAGIHYEFRPWELWSGKSFAEIMEHLHALLLYGGTGLLLTGLFCTLSYLFSGHYADFLGKE